MIPRILAFLVVAAILISLLVYSQTRPPLNKVSGFIEAHDIRVGSRVGGRIAKVLVTEGQHVNAGDVLIELEPYDLQSRLAEARATLAQRQAQLARLQNGFRPEEIAQATAHRDQLKAQLEKLQAGPRPQEIAEAQAMLDQAVSQKNLAQENYDRVSRTFASGGTSRDEMDTATNTLKVSQANATVRAEQLALLKEGTRSEDIAAAKAQLAEAEQALTLMNNGSRAEDIAAAKAAVDSQQAAIGALQQQLDELRIVAPAAGTIEAVDIRPGDLLPPNAPALSILESSELWVRAYLPENRGLTVGQKLRVTVDAFPGKTFNGTVSFVSRNAEFTPSNVQTPEERSKQVFRIRVTLDGPDKEALRAGMSADVWLTDKRATNEHE